MCDGEQKGYELVCADSHKGILSKLKADASEFRPDIVHQCLLALLDSPLNKAGFLKVFIQTTKVSATTPRRAPLPVAPQH